MINVFNIIVSIVNVYSLLIFVYVLSSWFPQPSGILLEVKNFLAKVCDPYLNIFKKFIPPIGGMVDISPIIALIVLQLAVRLLAALF